MKHDKYNCSLSTKFVNSIEDYTKVKVSLMSALYTQIVSLRYLLSIDAHI